MRLRKFTVRGLFGLFDHEIPLKLDERITIIHAPNGYGKTVILKLISNFFGGSLLIYRQVEFERIEFEFDDGGVAIIKQRVLPPNDKTPPSPNQGVVYHIAFHDSKGRDHKFDPWSEKPDTKKGEEYPPSDLPRVLEHYVPFLRRFAYDRFQDVRTGDQISLPEAVDRYWQYLPESARARLPHPQWLDELRSSVHCRLIETQRLIVSSKERSSTTGRGDTALIPAVKTDSAELVTLMKKSLADAATLSQSLDRTFPKRLLSEAANAVVPVVWTASGENKLRLVAG